MIRPTSNDYTVLDFRFRVHDTLNKRIILKTQCIYHEQHLLGV